MATPKIASMELLQRVVDFYGASCRLTVPIRLARKSSLPPFVDGELPPVEYGAPEDREEATKLNLDAAYVRRRTEVGPFRQFI